MMFKKGIDSKLSNGYILCGAFLYVIASLVLFSILNSGPDAYALGNKTGTDYSNATKYDLLLNREQKVP